MGTGSQVTSGVLSHIQEGSAELTQERYIWDGAEMPSPGTFLLKIYIFFPLEKLPPNYQNPNLRQFKIGPKPTEMGQVEGQGEAHML